MEESIGKLCNTVAKFCNNLQTSCSALKDSVERRPIPLDSASTTFVQSVNRRVSAACDDLNMLESMSFATVSFEELLGHCKEILKKNQTDLIDLQDYLRSSSNYIPPLDFDEEDVVDALSPGSNSGSKRSDIAYDDPLLDDSMSLKDFGISDVCLATIASQGACGEADSKFDFDEPESEMEREEVLESWETTDENGTNQYEDSKILLNVTRDDYESLPIYMKGLVPWEDLLAAVEKMNSYIQTKKIKPETFKQGEIESLGLGYKSKSYLLLLIKMNQLRVETNEGVIYYRLRSNPSE